MNYLDGNTAKIGDIVEIKGGYYGEVVCNIESGEYSPSFTRNEWSYLNNGLLLNTNFAGLVHYTKNTELIRLVRHSDYNT